jgi:hypothetical protein
MSARFCAAWGFASNTVLIGAILYEQAGRDTQNSIWRALVTPRRDGW